MNIIKIVWHITKDIFALIFLICCLNIAHGKFELLVVGALGFIYSLVFSTITIIVKMIAGNQILQIEQFHRLIRTINPDANLEVDVQEFDNIKSVFNATNPQFVINSIFNNLFRLISLLAIIWAILK